MKRPLATDYNRKFLERVESSIHETEYIADLQRYIDYLLKQNEGHKDEIKKLQSPNKYPIGFQFKYPALFLHEKSRTQMIIRIKVVVAGVTADNEKKDFVYTLRKEEFKANIFEVVTQQELEEILKTNQDLDQNKTDGKN